MIVGKERPCVLRNFSDSSGSQNQATLNDTFQRVVGGGGKTTTALNAQQLSDVLGQAQGLYGATGASYGTPLVQAGLGQVAGGAQGAAGLAGAGSTLAQNTLGGAYLNANPGSGFYGAYINDPNANTLQKTAGGAYLNANPYLDQTYNLAAGNLQNQLRSAWGGSDVVPGSSGVQQAALSTGLANLGNQIYGQNYQDERNRMLQAGQAFDTNRLAAAQGLSGNYSQAQANQLGTLGQVGALGQAQYAPGTALMQAGYTPMQQYLAALQGVSPGSTTTETKDVSQYGKNTSNTQGGSDQSTKGLNLF